jgi:hypothetical protein
MWSGESQVVGSVMIHEAGLCKQYESMESEIASFGDDCHVICVNDDLAEGPGEQY